MMPRDIGAIEGEEQRIQWEPHQEDFIMENTRAGTKKTIRSTQNGRMITKITTTTSSLLKTIRGGLVKTFGAPEEDSWRAIEAESQMWPQEAEAVQQTAATSSAGPVQSVSTIASTSQFC